MKSAGVTQLNTFNNNWYKPGKSFAVKSLWYITNSILLKSGIPGSAWRRILLKLYGAKMGKDVVLKPRINIKYPWKLEVGDYSWIGEQVWIDNLDLVVIGKNCCISQGAFLLCGNHNYKSPAFDLTIAPITLEDGVWIGAKSVVVPGVVCKDHSILTVGSIATKNLESYGIYSGNPASRIKERVIER